MSAHIIAFPIARVVNPEPSPTMAGGTDLAFSMERGLDLTAEDIAAIEEHLPKLRGSWSLEFLEDHAECLSAVLHKSSGWEAFRRTAVVQRQGAKLSASVRSHEGRKHLGEFENADLAMEAIGATLGLGSRRTARAEAPEEVKAEPGSRFPRAT